MTKVWQNLKTGRIIMNDNTFDFLDENFESLENLINETLSNFSDVNDIQKLDEKRLAKQLLQATEETVPRSPTLKRKNFRQSGTLIFSFGQDLGLAKTLSERGDSPQRRSTIV